MTEKKIITVSNAEVGKVIGVRGTVVRAIRLQSGASVEIDHGTGDNRPIHLAGEASQVAEAERLIWCAPTHLPLAPANASNRRRHTRCLAVPLSTNIWSR